MRARRVSPGMLALTAGALSGLTTFATACPESIPPYALVDAASNVVESGAPEGAGADATTDVLEDAEADATTDAPADALEDAP